MTQRFLAQRTVLDRTDPSSLRLPLVEAVEGLHPGGCFPLVEDPRAGDRALLVGMMVLRPASRSWTPAGADEEFGAGVDDLAGGIDDWCFDVAGLGGSWPVSGGDAVDAWRLALQYGTVDAVLAGAATMAREGVVAGARRGHLWQPYTPLSWPQLAGAREALGEAIREQRRLWQRLGVLSSRRYPAQVAITRSGRLGADGADLLDARVFHDRHPDGSAIEAWLLTSEAGAEVLAARARAKGMDLGGRLLVASPAGRPGEIDAAAVPALLRARLDARLVEHDGGAVSLEAFVEAGAVAQLNLTLMRGRSVRDVLATSPRLGDGERAGLLASWPRPARLFPAGGGSPTRRWRPVYAVADAAADGEAVAVTLDSRPAPR